MVVLTMEIIVVRTVFVKVVRMYKKTKVVFKKLKSKLNWGLIEVFLIMYNIMCQLRSVLVLKVVVRKNIANVIKQEFHVTNFVNA